MVKMQKNSKFIWIILIFFIVLGRYWYLVTPNKQVREYILRDFIQDGQMIAFLSALKKGYLLLWDITRGSGNLINNGMALFYPFNLLYLPFVRNDYIVHHVFQYMFVLHIFLMGVFTYLLLRELQASRPAAFIAGLIYSFNGYTMIHSMHLGLITTMTWLPLIFFFLERSRRQKRLIPIMWGGVVLGIAILASHPQIYYYMALAIVFYFLFWTIAGWSESAFLKERIRPLGHLIFLGAIAFGISAIQTVPAYSFSVSSIHATLGRDFKWINPLEFYQLAMLVIPWSLDAVKDWGILVSERYAYMGWATLIFGLAVLVWRREAKVYAYAVIAAFSLILAMGDNSVLFKFFFNFIPGYSMFRYPSRVLVLFVFGITVLAGLGLDYYLSESSPIRVRRRLPKILKVLAIGGLGLWIIGVGSLTVSVETSAHNHLINFVSQLTLALVVIWLWWGIVIAGQKHYLRNGFIVALTAVVLFDLWSPGAPATSFFSPDKINPKYESAINFLKERKVKGDVFRIENNFLRESHLRRYGISAYNTANRLQDRDYLDLMWTAEHNPRILDLLNVQYIIRSRPEDRQGKRTVYPDLNLIPNRLSTKILEFHDRPVRADTIELYSHLSFGAHILQGEKIAEITLWDREGQSLKFPIRAGIETSEWAIERPGLKARHWPARIAESWEPGEKGYMGHKYLAVFTLPQIMELVKVELKYLRTDGQLEISRIMVGGKDIDTLTDRFKNMVPDVMRNRYTLQRAFLVPKAKVISNPNEMRAALGWFDPERVVLLFKQPASVPEQNEVERGEEKPQEGNGVVKIVSYSPRKISIDVVTPITQYLVLSDTYHPWWQAKIDGKKTEVLKADLALRAVVIPQGNHKVEFYMVPVSFYLGAGITFATLLFVGIVAFLSWRRCKG